MLQERRCKYCDGKIPEGRRSEFCHLSCGKLFRRGHTSVRPRGQTQSICQQCGTPFEPTHSKQIYCTKECQRLSTRIARTCAVCGCDILKHARRSDRKTATLCSPECKQKHREQVEAQKKIDRFGPPRTCRWCGVTFGYGGEAYKGWCSKSCRAEYTKDYERRLGHERRARQRKATVEAFSPAYILKRDKYICQACGKKTKPKEKPTHPLYPNVDHIVPLAAGGEHSKKNCRCVCASCNSQKREGTLNDQLLLFG